ncbi:MAG: HK97-gp10 family putative phage morphogenesis protein [Pseudomonadota bacterium]
MMKIDVRGTEEIDKLLKEIAPNHALNIARSTVHGVAGSVRDVVRKKAPKATGVLAKSVKVKRRRVRNGYAASDVVAERGTGARNDGYYWRFVEYGTSKLSARPFILPSVREIEGDLPQVLRAQFVKKFEAAIRRAKKRKKR